MDGELLRSFMEAPSFGRSFGAMAELSMVAAGIASNEDFPLDDFEFAFTSIKSDTDTATETNADEIFCNGRMLPLQPIFSGNLVEGSWEKTEEKMELGADHLTTAFEKRCLRSGSSSSSSSMSSDAEDHRLSGVTAPYCDWKPRSAPQSPSRWWKSHSTGSADLESKRLRLRDIVFGRSPSDGKKKFVFVPASDEKQVKKWCFFRPSSSHKLASTETKKKVKMGMENREAVKEMDIAAAHQMYYAKGISGGGKTAMAISRRSFLPYRQDLLAGFGCHGRR